MAAVSRMLMGAGLLQTHALPCCHSRERTTSLTKGFSRPSACTRALRPRNLADAQRAQARSSLILPVGRPVEPVTQKRKDRRLKIFPAGFFSRASVWTSFSLEAPSTRLLNRLLVQDGRQLFEAGWLYSHYSEVINAVANKEPLLRRLAACLGFGVRLAQGRAPFPSRCPSLAVAFGPGSQAS
ncbi:unnamed protein product [Symbiodinium natans]|uniref:Uncharacterized protein n=1 Tax=Symbiodinium natans TaxID=878477 RepID=A0A812PXQ0_9DINO|nr:unnamed protein product [Symbiodinium natans]